MLNQKSKLWSKIQK